VLRACIAGAINREQYYEACVLSMDNMRDYNAIKYHLEGAISVIHKGAMGIIVTYQGCYVISVTLRYLATLLIKLLNVLLSY